MNPVLTSAQLREADACTISHEPIASIDLMERAANRCVAWVEMHFPLSAQPEFAVVCGPGNNGGDGLAIARLLFRSGHNVRAILCPGPKGLSPDAETNRQRLAITSVRLITVEMGSSLPVISGKEVVIDALFGTGLDRKLEGAYRELVMALNTLPNEVISIDMPSGLFAEDNQRNDPQAIVRADTVLTFETLKLALLLPENEAYVGNVEVLPIGLDVNFLASLATNYQMIEAVDVASYFRPRTRFAHKGHFGHALLISGSAGKAGAAVLAARACARSGVGLITVHLPADIQPVLHVSLPEAMVSSDGSNDHISSFPDLTRCTAIGIGPGIGTADDTGRLLKRLITEVGSPMVVDADALNLLAENRTWLAFLPPNSILTPHPTEFDRLTEKSNSGFERLGRARDFAIKFGVVLVLKGAHTAICAPNGKVFFNSTGNPGMAKGGSGDALTGIITGLLAQGLAPLRAAIAGVFVHGLAGDLAAAELGMDGMLPSDLIDRIPFALKKIRGSN